MRILTFIAPLLGGTKPQHRMAARTKLKGHEDEALGDAVAWCVAHGGCYADPEDATLYGHAPFALEPFPFPRTEYERVVELQPAFGRLVDAVARDAVWLEETLQETAASDEFTRKLLEMRRDADAAGLLQTCSLGLLRSDYMLDAPGGDAADGSGKALQVELNTIASSFGCLSSVISGLHAYIAQKYEATPGVLPPNNAREGLCAGLAAAHMEFARQFPPTDLVPRRVAMVVQPGERNQMDQRMLEHGLWDGYGIDLRRVTLLDVADNDGSLIFGEGDDAWEASVVYFRAGYAPDDYPSDKEWRARAVIERSRSIKCPTVAYQLAGCKKVQQALAPPGVLERWLPHDAEALRSVFAGLYSLDVADGSEVDAIVKQAIANPSNFVLKPQREGGGNNLYGAELKQALETMSPAERAAYVLMDIIRPPAKLATLVRDGEAVSGACVCELGIYGTILTDGSGKVVHEACVGHLLRQKSLGVDEGGVAAGFACLSSPALV